MWDNGKMPDVEHEGTMFVMWESRYVATEWGAWTMYDRIQLHAIETNDRERMGPFNED